jgi:hypothetical protein
LPFVTSIHFIPHLFFMLHYPHIMKGFARLGPGRMCQIFHNVAESLGAFWVTASCLLKTASSPFTYSHHIVHWYWPNNVTLPVASLDAIHCCYIASVPHVWCPAWRSRHSSCCHNWKFSCLPPMVPLLTKFLYQSSSSHTRCCATTGIQTSLRPSSVKACSSCRRFTRQSAKYAGTSSTRLP